MTYTSGLVPIAEASDAATVVRNYLLVLADPSLLIDGERVKTLTQAANDTKGDPLARLWAIAELERAKSPSADPYREAFVGVVKAWAEENDVPASALATLGVPADVLRAAGMVTGRAAIARPSQRGPRAKEPTNAASIKRAALGIVGPFTYKDLGAVAGGSPMTLRKAVAELLAEGKLFDHGRPVKPGQIGRAEVVFATTPKP